MVPPGGTVFNAVNPIVTGTANFPALRSSAKITKLISNMGREILPDSTASDAISSDDVCTAMRGPPAVMYPNVNPLSVTVNADNDGIAAPAVVMMTEVVVVAPHVAVKPATLLPPAATVGVTEGMKKPEGYVKVMVPPGGIPLKKEGVKPIVTGASLFPDLRSEGCMKKETF
jgi:hypothetical protein